MVSVFLYVPNLIGTFTIVSFFLQLIGYARIAMAISSYHYISTPSKFLPLYMISCLLDAVDGHAARFLGQSSKFGAVLDMVTDRSTTAGLICYLASIYPSFMIIFQCLLGLDLSSHYMHMYASLTSGAVSHKSIDGRQHWLLRAYYHYQSVLFAVCAGNELFFLGLYLKHHSGKESVVFSALGNQFSRYEVFTMAVFPIFAFKQFMNVVQLIGASKRLAGMEKKSKQ